MKVRKLFGVLVALVGVTALALAAANLAGAHASHVLRQARDQGRHDP